MREHERVMLREPAVVAKIGASRSSLWSWVRSGKFPSPVRLSENIVAWSSDDVEAWIDEKILATKKSLKSESPTLAGAGTFKASTASEARSNAVR